MNDLEKINVDVIHSVGNPSINYRIFAPALFYQVNPLMNNTEIFILDFYNKNPNYDFYFTRHQIYLHIDLLKMSGILVNNGT